MEKLVETKKLNMHYPISAGFRQKPTSFVYALNNVDLSIYKGEILGLVGESGCGKSTLGRCILNLIKPTSGEVLFEDENILDFNKSQTKKFRKKAQLIFQNPFSSLNPRMNVFNTLKEPLIVHKTISKKEITEKVKATIELVGLNQNIINLYPHEFSGGQRQRIAIARALMLDPAFIVADEPVSALDVSIQAQIINLLIDLKEKLNLTMLFISHDLSVIKYVSNRVAVMYLGEIAETGTSDEIFNSPQHPYTKALLSSISTIDKNKGQRILLQGDLPSPQNPPSGCKFHTRCPVKINICPSIEPVETQLSTTHKARCHLLNRDEG